MLLRGRRAIPLDAETSEQLGSAFPSVLNLKLSSGPSFPSQLLHTALPGGVGVICPRVSAASRAGNGN